MHMPRGDLGELESQTDGSGQGPQQQKEHQQQRQPSSSSHGWEEGLCMGAALGLPGGGSPEAYPHSICPSINSPDCTVTGTVDAWALNFVSKLL